jgi:hypothetical protein
MNEGALAHIDDNAILERIAAGEYQSHIARELKVAPQSLHERLTKHPNYRAALAARNAANLDSAQELVDWSPDLARAREQFRVASWRAERECKEIWGAATTQINISGSQVTIGQALEGKASRLLEALESQAIVVEPDVRPQQQLLESSIISDESIEP